MAGTTMAFYDDLLQSISMIIELAGIGTIAVGFVGATFFFFVRLRRRVVLSRLYHDYRTSLARVILLGLEFLVASDIIGTVAVDPSLDTLYVLGLIVLIRTFLSFSLEIEIEGRLPWRKGQTSSS